MALEPTLSVPTDVLMDLMNERIRQKTEEGWTDEHDDKHVHGELARAAACYAAPVLLNDDDAPLTWPWDKKWWKSTTRRRNLVKSGALVIAEIERLDRAEAAALDRVEKPRALPLPLAYARANDLCRYCGESVKTEQGTTYNYGKEFAHTRCYNAKTEEE